MFGLYRELDGGNVSVRIHGKGNASLKPHGEFVLELIERIRRMNATDVYHMFRALLLLLAGSLASPAAERPRLCVLTAIGGDPDDEQSMVRLMVYANEFEIEGLIADMPGANPRGAVYRWRPAFQADFARRMSWCADEWAGGQF